MNAVQFLRLVERLESIPPIVRRTVEAMSEGRTGDAESISGGKGSPDWWAADFVLVQLAEHGVMLPARKTAAAPPRAMSLFAD